MQNFQNWGQAGLYPSNLVRSRQHLPFQIPSLFEFCQLHDLKLPRADLRFSKSNREAEVFRHRECNHHHECCISLCYSPSLEAPSRGKILYLIFDDSDSPAVICCQDMVEESCLQQIKKEDICHQRRVMISKEHNCK